LEIIIKPRVIFFFITIKTILAVLKIGHKKNMLRIGYFIKTIYKYLSLDETSLSNGELYTILTKGTHGKKGSIVAIVKVTQTDDVINILHKTPLERRNIVKEI
jgi:transposase